MEAPDKSVQMKLFISVISDMDSLKFVSFLLRCLWIFAVLLGLIDGVDAWKG